jgi:NAD(P)-dependent dehydrogenase (short-subunit alcohol dehydrogenase family)
MDRVKDKVSLVTGGARGIGEAICRRLAAEGAKVIVADLDAARGEALADELNHLCGAENEDHMFLPLDVTDEGAWQRGIEAVLDRYGRLDVLVNNAGITGVDDAAVAHDPEHETLENWMKVHRVNLGGCFLGCKHAIRAMRRTGKGSIINMSSRAGLVGIPGAVAYASSKAAIRNHSKSVALYCAEQHLNIRSNSIHPAAILTPMWETVLGDGPDRREREKFFVKDTPLQRFGTPEEVAWVVLFLASDESSYMTGEEVNVDGGILAGTFATPMDKDKEKSEAAKM